MKADKFVFQSRFTLPLRVAMLVLLVCNLLDNQTAVDLHYYVSNICTGSS